MIISQNIYPLELRIVWEIVNKAINVETRLLRKINNTFIVRGKFNLIEISNLKNIVEQKYDTAGKLAYREEQIKRIKEIIMNLKLLEQQRTEINREINRLKSANEYFLDKNTELKRSDKKLKIRQRISIVESEIKDLEEQLQITMERARIFALKLFDLKSILDENSSLKFSENMRVKELAPSDKIQEKQFNLISINDSDGLKRFIENQKEQLNTLQKDSVDNDRETGVINYRIQYRKLYLFALRRDYKFCDEGKTAAENYWEGIESEYLTTYKTCLALAYSIDKFSWLKKIFRNPDDATTVELIMEKDPLSIFSGFNLEFRIYKRIKEKIKNSDLYKASTNCEYYSTYSKLLEITRKRFLESQLRKCSEVITEGEHLDFNQYDFESIETYLDNIIGLVKAETSVPSESDSSVVSEETLVSDTQIITKKEETTVDKRVPSRKLKQFAKETCQKLIERKGIKKILIETKKDKCISLLVITEIEKKYELSTANKETIHTYFRKLDLQIIKKNGKLSVIDNYKRMK